MKENKAAGESEGKGRSEASGGARPKPAPVLPAHAGDLHFEYTPAVDSESSSASGGQEEEKESNRAPSPGGYTGSRTIHVVSYIVR